MKKSFANRMVDIEFEVMDVNAFGLLGGGHDIDGCVDGWTGGCGSRSSCGTCPSSSACGEVNLGGHCSAGITCSSLAYTS